MGKIKFVQPQEQHWEDTTILIEYLIHADGATVNSTFDHSIAIHERAPNKDFYDWQNRCVSTGNIFDYRTLSSNQNKTAELDYSLLGDLSSRHDRIRIAGSIKDSHITRVLFTDNRISLSGKESIIGKSIVILDENGPKARGNRMACSM